MLPVVQLLKQANDNNDDEEPIITPIRVNNNNQKNQKPKKNHLDILVTTTDDPRVNFPSKADDGTTKSVLASDDPQDEQQQQHVTLLNINNNNNKLSSKTMFAEHDGDVGTTATVVVDAAAAAAAKEIKMDFPVIKTTTTTTKSTLINKSSLPETLDVIDENSSFSSSSSASSSSTSSPRKPIKTQMIEQSVYNNYHCTMKTYESGMGSRKKWPIKQLRSSSQQQKTAISTFRSNSETSSVVSTCSSSESETRNDFTNDATLSHDVSPDSPDSGVSGSVNSTDDKCSDEDSDDFFQIVYDKTNNLQYVGNNVDNFTTCSLLNLIQPEHDQIKEIVDEQPKSENDDEQNVQKKQLATDDEEELTEAPRNQETTDSDQQIDKHDCSVSSDSSCSEATIIKTPSDDYDEFERELFKEVAALVPTLSKSFDEILNVLKRGPSKEPEKEEQNEEQIENDESGACSPLHFNLDCSSENSSANHLNEMDYTQSFDWSIKTQGASDMQSMIKEIKMNARNLKNNQLNKKPQIFICQWHDCDWPGNYEDLADHLREIHVELQPFLDANGKVIKWNKKTNKTRREDELISDDFDGTSQTTLDSDEEEEDDNNKNDSASDDDTQSSRLVTRGSKRLRTQFASSFKSNLKNSSKTTTRRRKKNSTVAETEKFVCLWRDCKVYGKPSLSRNWIERHVLEQHSGPKPFKCIVDNCGQRFRTQNQMEKHVNMHFKPSNGNHPVTDLKLLMNNHHPNHHNNNKPPIFNHNQNDGKTIGSSKNSCCYCHCHSNCDSKFYDDTSTSTLSGKNRLDKTNRSSSVDSGISLQSCSSSISEVFPSTSTSSSSSSSSSLTKCLSKSKKIEHCHSSCCVMNKSISLDFKSSKILKNNKKKSNPNFKAKKIPHDYLDDEFSLRVAFELQARDAFRSNLDHYSPYEKWIEFPDGRMQKLQTPKKGESINDVIDRLKKRLSSPFKVVNVFQEELFHMDRMDKSSFKTDLIACKIRADNQFYYTSRSRLPGLMEDRNIPESRIHKPRICNERFAPKSFSLASLCRKNTKCDKQKESKIGKRSRTDPRPYDYTRLEFVPVDSDSEEEDDDDDSEDEDADSTGGHDPPDEEFNGDEDDDNEENWIEIDDDSDDDCIDLTGSEDHTSANSIVVLEDEYSQNESDDDDDDCHVIDPTIVKNSTSDEEMNANDPPTRGRRSTKRRNIRRNRKEEQQEEEEEEEISTIKKRLRKR